MDKLNAYLVEFVTINGDELVANMTHRDISMMCDKLFRVNSVSWVRIGDCIINLDNVVSISYNISK